MQTLAFRQSRREIGYGSRIDIGLVPLLDDRKIRLIRLPALAALPAIALEIIGGGGEHVGHAGDEVTAAVAITGLTVPLTQFVEQTVQVVARELGFEKPDQFIDQLGLRWQNGKLVLHPADPNLQTKEVPLEVFFHKIVMLRNNLRVLEQKINGHEKLTDADKVELQQYITRSYGSLTTFNVLFKNKADQFSGVSGD